MPGSFTIASWLKGHRGYGGNFAMICRMFKCLRQSLVTVLLVGLCLPLWSCRETAPLKIGFVGGLTGRVADLGVAGRDAVILAVEEKNQAGGIAGRKVELVVKDDRQNDKSAREAIRELASEQVAAIIGPMTSAMAAVMLPMINSNQIVTVSPTVKSDQFSGQDDFFFRVTAPLSRNAEQMALHAVKDLHLKRFAVVYDVSNRAFTETWLNHFSKTLLANGGQIATAEEFNSQPNVHFSPIIDRLLQTHPEGVLLLSNAIDTALLAQQIRKQGSTVALFSTEWAFTTDLLSFGGRAVNGMTSFHSFNANSQEATYLAFKQKFTKRFGYEPSFATVLAYDATTYLFAGLENNPDRNGLKDALLKLVSFSGLQSKIWVDEYGDVERKLFMTVVESGQFQVVE